MTVFVRYQDDGSVTLRFPYDAAFIEDLKKTIPGRQRTFSPPDKLWTVRPMFARDAEDLCKSWFDDVEVIFYQRPDAPSARSVPSGPYADLYLLDTAPLPVVDAVYKALARLYHPDKGGDTATMQRINAAFTAIKERSDEWEP